MLNHTEATQISSASKTISQEEQVENCNDYSEGNGIENADLDPDELSQVDETDSDSEQDDPLWSPEENDRRYFEMGEDNMQQTADNERCLSLLLIQS